MKFLNGGQPNTAPGGSTTISGNYSQNESNRTTYATIGSLSATLLDNSDPNKLRLTSATNSTIGADFEGILTVDHRLLSEVGRENIVKDFKELGQNLNKNPLTPMGLSILIENYTGHELSWAPGDVARFKEKGKEFATAVPGAATSALTGSDLASGAIAGVIGEQIAETAFNNGVNRQTAIQLASLTSAISSITYSSLTNQSDEQIANNAWEGSRIGGNAGKENATYFMDKKILNYPEERDYDLHFGIQGTLGHATGSFGTNGSGLTAEINPSYGIAGYISYSPRNENEFSTISYGIRSGPSLGVIITDQQNYGYTASFGPAFQIYPIPYNISIPIPTSNLNK